MDALAPGHLVVIAALAAVLFFGWRQLPDMSRSLGRSLRIFKREMKGMADDDTARPPQVMPPAAGPVGGPVEAATVAPTVTDDYHR